MYGSPGSKLVTECKLSFFVISRGNLRETDRDKGSKSQITMGSLSFAVGSDWVLLDYNLT